MIECKKSALHIDSRGTSRGYNLSHGILLSRLAQVPHEGPLWRKRYPAMQGILKSPELPTGNVFERNAVVRCPKVHNMSGKPKHFRDLANRDNEAFEGDPGFANEKAMDYWLRPGNKIAGRIKGFKAAAIERAASWSTRAGRGSRGGRCRHRDGRWTSIRPWIWMPVTGRADDQAMNDEGLMQAADRLRTDEQRKERIRLMVNR